MAKSREDQTLAEIINTAPLHLWEDASESFCLLKYAALSGKKVLLLFDATATEAERSYAKRFVATFGGIEYSLFEVNFHATAGIVPAGDPGPLIAEAEKGDRICLYYKSRFTKPLTGAYVTTLQFLNRISTSLYLPNFRSRCEEMYLYYSKDIEKLMQVDAFLGDELSRATLREIVRVFTTNGIYTLQESTRRTKYFDCYRHKEDEVWVNCGSCEGDTIFNYLSAGYSFTRILAIEGDKNFFAHLAKNISLLPEETKKKIRTLEYFIGGDNDEKNFDRLFAHVPVSLINMDIEGFEMPVLRGAATVIRKYRPVLAICAYHVSSDLYEIPAFIDATVGDYSFYLRKYCGFEGNAFNEFVYYCVPNERRLDQKE